jgi:hypothetical protein
MTTNLIQPLLAFTLVEIAIILALLAIIAAALVSIAVTLSKTRGSSGPSPDQQALTNLQGYMTEVLTQGLPVTAARCQRLRQLLQDARTAGVSSVVLNQLSGQIDKLCPG